jgi:hypothetical protein
MSYRPITDVWILARPKVAYHGAFPSGFLSRARELLGVSIFDPVLHVCAGRVRDYPFRGFGPNDRTLDLDPLMAPDFCRDAREALPVMVPDGWPALLVDRPYTREDASRYTPGPDVLPEPNALLRNCLASVRPGGRVGFLDYYLPRPPKDARFVACVGVVVGYGNRMRCYSVFERGLEEVQA